MEKYKLVFRNQTEDDAPIGELMRETKMYLFLKYKGKPTYCRVNKKTLKTKWFATDDSYNFDGAMANFLIKIN